MSMGKTADKWCALMIFHDIPSSSMRTPGKWSFYVILYFADFCRKAPSSRLVNKLNAILDHWMMDPLYSRASHSTLLCAHRNAVGWCPSSGHSWPISCRVSMSMNTWNSEVLKNLVKFRAWNVEIFWRSRFLGTTSQQVWGRWEKPCECTSKRLGEEVEGAFCFQQSSPDPPKGTWLHRINPYTYWILLKPKMREQAMYCLCIEKTGPQMSTVLKRLVILKCATGCALGARLNVSQFCE